MRDEPRGARRTAVTISFAIGPDVEGLGAAFGDAPQGFGISGILEDGACGQGRALGGEIERARFRELREQRRARDRLVQPRAHRKSLFRKLDGGREKLGPSELAVLRMRAREQRHDARHAHGIAALPRLDEIARLAVRREEDGWLGALGRRFSAVQGFERALRLIVVEQEGAAAEAGGLRLDEREHGLHGDGRIDRRAAFAQDFEACVHRERMRRNDDVSLGQLFAREEIVRRAAA